VIGTPPNDCAFPPFVTLAPGGQVHLNIEGDPDRPDGIERAVDTALPVTRP
jgi:hypothetical protein